MRHNPIWTCEVSQFNWHYDAEEHCVLVEGDVTVTYGAGGKKSATFGKGDYVVFPRGLSCVWNVKAPVKKHYILDSMTATTK